MRHLHLWAATAGLGVGGCVIYLPCDEDTSDPDTDEDVTYLDYRYARIDDLSEDERTGTPGAEIDAVELRSASGSPKGYAVNISYYEPVNELINEHMDTAEAMGAPSAECYEDQGFVNLGGIGGTLILDFGTQIIEDNDTIIVYEVGGCVVEGGGMTIEDPIQLSVSVSDDPFTGWYTIGVCDGGTCTFPIGTLPMVPASP